MRICAMPLFAGSRSLLALGRRARTDPSTGSYNLLRDGRNHNAMYGNQPANAGPLRACRLQGGKVSKDKLGMRTSSRPARSRRTAAGDASCAVHVARTLPRGGISQHPSLPRWVRLGGGGPFHFTAPVSRRRQRHSQPERRAGRLTLRGEDPCTRGHPAEPHAGGSVTTIMHG